MVQPPTLLYTVYSPLLLPYSHAAYSPFLNSDEPQEKKTNWNKAKQPPKEGGRISQVAKELQIQQLSLEDPYPALLHQISQDFGHYHLQRNDLGPMPYQLLLA